MYRLLDRFLTAKRKEKQTPGKSNRQRSEKPAGQFCRSGTVETTAVHTRPGRPVTRALD